MNNVNNRKMFRPRGARNKLNQMGGIMASSAPLMQTVQRFSTGGQPRLGGGPVINRPALGSNLSLPSFDPYGRGILGSLKRFLLPPRAQNVAAMEDAQLNQQQPLPVPAPRLSDTFEPDTSISTYPMGLDDAAIDPDQIGLFAEKVTEDSPYLGTRETRYVNTTPERIKRAMEITSGERGFDQTIPGFFEDQKAAMQSEADRQLAEQRRRITDPEEIARLKENTTGPGVKKTKSDAQNVVKQNAPTVLESQVGDIDQNASRFAKDVVDAAESLTSETDKNDLFLEVANKKEPEEKLTLKQRFDRNKEVAKELGLFQGDTKEDKTIDGYNLAMMGFLIASGDSPNALSNIAKGAAAGAENFRKTAQARKERKDKLESFALTNALTDERAAIQWEREMEKYDKGLKYDWMKTVKASDDVKAQTVAKIASTRSNLMLQLANTNAEGRKDRAFKLQYALFSNFDDAMPVAVYQAQQQGLDIGDQEVFDDVILPNAMKISEMLAEQKISGTRPLRETVPIVRRSDAFEQLVQLQATDPGSGFIADGRLTPKGQAFLDERERVITGEQGSGAPVNTQDSPVRTKEDYDAIPPGASFYEESEDGTVTLKRK